MKRSRFTIREGLVMQLGVALVLIVMLWLMVSGIVAHQPLKKVSAKVGNTRAFRSRRMRPIVEEESIVRTYAPVLAIAFAFICSGRSFTQSVEKEAAAVLELGAAAGRSLTEGQSTFGPTVAVEVTPIENWLELEAGVTPLFRRHSTEWSVNLLFKKPWTVSDRVEFMLGFGPEWIHTNAYGIKMSSVGAEVAPDFMLWSSKKHRFGWYLEPSYDYKFGPGHEHSLGISGGLLISIP